MGLAKGAGSAVRIDDAGLGGADSIALARVLAEFFKKQNFDVIFCGAIATDDGSSQVGPALAELLGRPHAAYVTKLEAAADKLTVKRELEGGFLDVKELALPAVVTIQTGGNSPRYASIMGIKRAGAKTIDVQSATAATSLTQLVKLYVPEVTSAAQMLDGTVDEKAQKLAALLKEKGAA
jgi:electron transfer flavoprotein beta subunit